MLMQVQRTDPRAVGIQFSSHEPSPQVSPQTRNDVYETLCPQPFACQEGFISFQWPNLQRTIT